MARAKSPFMYSGRIYNMIFKVQNGKQVVYLAPEEKPERHKKRMAEAPEFDSYRDNILEFAMASATAQQIYRSLMPKATEHLGPILRPYAQNYLTAKLKAAADHHNKMACKTYVPWMDRRWYGRSLSILDVAHALTGLDIGHEGAPTAMVAMKPIGPRHNPNAIRVTGLEKAAKAIHCHGNAHLECRIHINQVAFDERVRTADHSDHTTWEEANNLPEPAPGWNGYLSRPSDWIPAQILPAEGLLLELPEAPADAKFITSIQVEWREIRKVGRKIIQHHKMGISRIVSVHGPAERFLPPKRHAELGPEPTQETHQICPTFLLKGGANPKIRWEQDPQAYLKQALEKLKPK